MKNGKGIMLYVWEDISVKVLSNNFSSAESFFVEIIIHKEKRFINCSYNANGNNIKNHAKTISITLDGFLAKYKSILLQGNFNACVNNETVNIF